jgi:hypothetical protein
MQAAMISPQHRSSVSPSAWPCVSLACLEIVEIDAGRGHRSPMASTQRQREARLLDDPARFLKPVNGSVRLRAFSSLSLTLRRETSSATIRNAPPCVKKLMTQT